MNYKPDYGLKLLNDGVSSNIDLHFSEFPLFSLTLLGKNQYSTMLEMPMDGVVYALSLDFNQEQLDNILSNANTNSVNIIKTELLRDSVTPRTIDYEEKIIFDAIAQIGDLQSNQNESFAPLVLKNMLSKVKKNSTKDKVDKDNQKEILREISEIFSMNENAINSHPKKIVSLYNELKMLLRSGQHQNWENEYENASLILSSSDIVSINNYIVSSSFISAWYHLDNDKEKRDKATHSCVALISSLGLKTDGVMRKYIETEKLWRRAMKNIGLGSKKYVGLIIAVIIIIIGVVMFLKS